MIAHPGSGGGDRSDRGMLTSCVPDDKNVAGCPGIQRPVDGERIGFAQIKCSSRADHLRCLVDGNHSRSAETPLKKVAESRQLHLPQHTHQFRVLCIVGMIACDVTVCVPHVAPSSTTATHSTASEMSQIETPTVVRAGFASPKKSA